MRVVQVVGLAVAGVLLATGTMVAYDTAQTFNENRCWGCLALEPKPGIFTGFWVEYPASFDASRPIEHPEWVRRAAANHSVIMLFFWYEGCSSCAVLWEKLTDEGLVTGGEDDGTIIGVEEAHLFTVDIEKDDLRKGALPVYSPEEPPSAPTTVVLFERGGTIFWYAFTGSTLPRTPQDEPLTVTAIVEEALR